MQDLACTASANYLVVDNTGALTFASCGKRNPKVAS
jgi:hypothetical protein